MDFDFLGLDRFLQAALNEDVGTGDVTTNCCVPEDAVSEGIFIAKETGIVCGLDIAAHVFSLLDAGIRFTPHIPDGSPVSKGDVIADISGPSRGILTGERTALNLLQHMSGIERGRHWLLRLCPVLRLKSPTPARLHRVFVYSTSMPSDVAEDQTTGSTSPTGF